MRKILTLFALTIVVAMMSLSLPMKIGSTKALATVKMMLIERATEDVGQWPIGRY